MKYTISVTLSELKATRKLLGSMSKPTKQDMGLTDYECDEELKFFCTIDDFLNQGRIKKL